MNTIEPQDQMISSGVVARDFGVNVRTIDNWQGNKDLAFPEPAVINGRRYWSRSAIEAWKASRRSTAIKHEAA